MGAKQRILKYLEFKGIEKRKFASKMGFSHTILNSGDNLGSEKLEKIISIYKDLDLNWLVTGKGNMILSPKVSPKVSPNFKKTHNIASEPEAEYNTTKDFVASISEFVDKRIENKLGDLEDLLYTMLASIKAKELREELEKELERLDKEEQEAKQKTTKQVKA